VQELPQHNSVDLVDLKTIQMTIKKI
jgi:hypothetical protein